MGSEENEPARMKPLAPSEWPEEMKAALAALRPANPRHPFPAREPGRPKGLNALGMLAHHPDLATAYHTFNGHVLFGTTLSARQRELVILRVSHRRDSDYEWAQHAVLAGDAGISPDEVEAVRSEELDAWSPLEAALLQATDELIEHARIGADSWSALAAELEIEQLMDVVFTVGAYDALAMAFRTFDVEMDDDLRTLLDED